MNFVTAQVAALKQQNGKLYSEIVYHRNKLRSEFSTNDKLRSGNFSAEELDRRANVAGGCIRKGLAVSFSTTSYLVCLVNNHYNSKGLVATGDYRESSSGTSHFLAENRIPF
jgi:hypothetical protein